MKCLKCNSDNPEGVVYCGQCGAKLERICPQCNSTNPAHFKFCGQCGCDLSGAFEEQHRELSFEEKIDRISRYLPQGLTEKILSQRERIEGERKQVTVMFCDMHGFTPLVEKIGPEEAYEIMDQVYEILIHKVCEYEGTVNEMTGDGIMALFGAPIALEDAPQRSIRSAMAIHRELTKFNDRIMRERKNMSSVQMRIGINTGPVVVGTLGNNLRVEFKAVGDTVNLASRMEGMAEPGATYVSEDTFRLAEGFFRFEALGGKPVKGKKEQVRVYRVIAPSTRRTRFDVNAESGLTPFVGREKELELLLETFERSKAGFGQSIAIVSDAGVGKSRLLYEFRKKIANEDVTFLEGKCLSYSRGVAYHPVIDILKSNFDIHEEDDSAIRDKVEQGLKAIGMDIKSTLPYILELLSVKDSGLDKIPMSPEAKKDRTIEALKAVLLKGSELRHLVIAVEDLHWIDKSSEECYREFLNSISAARVLLLFTYRPEFVLAWGGKSYHSQINVNRLSNMEILTMVSHLLGTGHMSRDLEELILTKTEGVAFFIEELIKSLNDLDLIVKKDGEYFLKKGLSGIDIPSTIHDVIMARVDSLPEGAKDVLQTGSAIEREFDYKLIKMVTNLTEKKLLTHLSALKNAELLYERGIYPETTYIFKHALTREVVYDSILKKNKKTLHGIIGQAIEQMYAYRIEEYYELLAHHYIESENYEKGAEYSKLVCKKDLKKSQYIAAIENGKKRVFCVEKLPVTQDNQKKIIDAKTALSGYYLALNYHFEAKETVDTILDLNLKLGYHKRLPSIYTAIGSYLLVAEKDRTQGEKYLVEAIKISEEVGDFVSLWFAAYFLGGNLSLDCQFDKGAYYLNKSIELGVAANNLIPTTVSRSTLSICNYVFQGKIDLAYKASRESLETAIKSEDILVETIAYICHGLSCYHKGLFDDAEQYLLEGLDFCTKSHHVVWGGWGSIFLGELNVQLGNYEKAEEFYNNAIEFFAQRQSFYPSYVLFSKVSGERPKALSRNRKINVSKLFEYYKCININYLKGISAHHIGDILLNMDDSHLSDAHDWIGKAIESDTRNQAKWSLANDYALYAELLRRTGDKPHAKENYNKAIEIFRNCGADGWVDKTKKSLQTLH